MSALNAKLFRDYFGGTWDCSISENGKPIGNAVLSWPEAFGKCLGTPPGRVVPEFAGLQDSAVVAQVAIAGWRSDIKRWCDPWYNEKGGYGEVQWTSIQGDTLYGFCHEIKEEDADPIEWVISLKMLDQDHFNYNLISFKGTMEVVGKRTRTAKELDQLMAAQAKTVKSFAELANFKK
jgi:hypothetical protein